MSKQKITLILELSALFILIVAMVIIDGIAIAVFGFCGDAGAQRCEEVANEYNLFFAAQFFYLVILFSLFFFSKSFSFLKYIFWFLVFFTPLLVASWINGWLLLHPPAFILAWITGVTFKNFSPKKNRLFWEIFIIIFTFLAAIVLIGKYQGRI